MKKILLICCAGMSTSALVKKMQEEATKQNLEVEIWASGTSEAQKEYLKADIMLLGPQVKYMLKTMEKMVDGKIPVLPIDMMMYGRMDGVAVLKTALDKIESGE